MKTGIERNREKKKNLCISNIIVLIQKCKDMDETFNKQRSVDSIKGKPVTHLRRCPAAPSQNADMHTAYVRKEKYHCH